MSVNYYTANLLHRYLPLPQMSEFVPRVTNIVNLSLTSGQFHPVLRESVISHSSRNPPYTKISRPISNLSLVPKIIECIVETRLTDHLTSNKVLNPHYPAYCKHHSTEAALLYIHDHLVNAIRSQKLSCLCLLDLSAAFDTIDHSTLLTHLLSWFGIYGSVLNWFKSYLSSRSFRVRCNNIFSSLYISSCGVPKAPFLVLCFSSCTLPPSPLSSPPFP